MIARFAFAVLMIVLSGWLYWLTALVMRAIDRAEQIIDREHNVLPEAEDEPVDEDEPEDVEPAPRYPRLRAAAEAVNARMQPTFLEPEPPVTEPSPVVRPSPVPRDPAPATEPMELGDEMAADAHAHVAREAVLSDEEWQAKQEAEHAEFLAWLDGVAKGEVA